MGGWGGRLNQAFPFEKGWGSIEKEKRIGWNGHLWNPLQPPSHPIPTPHLLVPSHPAPVTSNPGFLPKTYRPNAQPRFQPSKDGKLRQVFFFTFSTPAYNWTGQRLWFFYNSWFQQCMFKQDMWIICIVLVSVHYAVSTNIPYARLVARKGRNWEWRLSWRQQHCTLLSASSSPLLSSFSFPSSSSFSSSSFSYPLFPATSPSSSLFFTKTCWPTYNILFSLPREA